MRTNRTGGHVWLALLLAVLAALLSTTRLGYAYQAVALVWSAAMEEEEDELAGAVGAFPDMAVPP